MQVIIAFCKKKDKNDKLSINDGNFLNDYFDNNNIKMVNANNIILEIDL